MHNDEPSPLHNVYPAITWRARALLLAGGVGSAWLKTLIRISYLWLHMCLAIWRLRKHEQGGML